MAELGRILIADDEPTFLRSTADLLIEEGYDCTCAANGTEAAEKLGQAEYDLLIADIKMPGNPELELIKEVPQIAEGLPVILVTGYPSLDSAIRSIELPVVSYLIKPIELDHLLEQVSTFVRRHKTKRTLQNMEQRFQDWRKYLAGLEEVAKVPTDSGSSVSVDTFLRVTLGNLASSLSDMRNMVQMLVDPKAEQNACSLLNCPRLSELKEAVKETVEVLEETKASFKSKRLGELRNKLERLF